MRIVVTLIIISAVNFKFKITIEPRRPLKYFFFRLFHALLTDCREEFNRCKIHCMDKICLELGPFEELQTLHCKLWPSTPRNVYHHVITFFNHVNET